MTPVLRKFGINETYQLAMYLLDQYRGTILSCRHAIPSHPAPAVSRSQLEEAVKVAIVGTVLRHPMLQVAVIQLECLDLTQHINWLYIGADEDFELTPFPDLSIKQPGWNITVIRQGDAPIMEVLLLWNHPQFDGAGARVFHEDLRDRSGGDIPKLPQAPLLLLAESSSSSQFLNRDVSQAIWCPIRSFPCKTQFRAFFVDETSLVGILALCRQNKTTITGLLNGLALIAFSSHLDSTVAPAFQSSTIIDHRRNLPPAPTDAPWIRSDRAVCNYSWIRSKLPIDAKAGRGMPEELQREPWAVSAQNWLEIVRKLEGCLRNDLVGLFKYVTDWQKTMSGMAKKPRQFTWLVTNIGVLDGNRSTRPSTTKPVDDHEWSIHRAQFGLSAEIPAAAIEFAPFSVAGHGMCVSANWPDCAST
ncbi:hypothetical protein F5Y08DRAFT_332349 [Xylaria arbuscula]|nr:hypothetical protein F5Y08DRAFT_332349 [Xylaria arbuscula]